MHSGTADTERRRARSPQRFSLFSDKSAERPDSDNGGGDNLELREPISAGGDGGGDGGQTPSQDGSGTGNGGEDGPDASAAGGKDDITSCRRRRRSNQAPYLHVWRTLMDGDVHVLAPLSLHIHLDYLRLHPASYFN